MENIFLKWKSWKRLPKEGRLIVVMNNSTKEIGKPFIFSLGAHSMAYNIDFEKFKWAYKN